MGERAFTYQVQFKPSNTLRQKLVHPKDKTPRHKQSNGVHPEPGGMHIRETKQPVYKQISCNPTDKGEGPQQKLDKRAYQRHSGIVGISMLVPRAILSGSAPS